MDLEVFIEEVRLKTNKRREKSGLPMATRPQLKKLFRLLHEDPKLSKMTEDQMIRYAIGWFMM